MKIKTHTQHRGRGSDPRICWRHRDVARGARAHGLRASSEREVELAPASKATRTFLATALQTLETRTAGPSRGNTVPRQLRRRWSWRARRLTARSGIGGRGVLVGRRRSAAGEWSPHWQMSLLPWSRVWMPQAESVDGRLMTFLIVPNHSTFDAIPSSKYRLVYP